MGIHFKRSEKSFLPKRNFTDALIAWGKSFCAYGLASLTDGSLKGSLSFRYGLGFVITTKNVDLKNIKDTDLIYVESWDHASSTLTYRGNQSPPEESFLHAMIYQNRSSAIFTFFLHPLPHLHFIKDSCLPIIHDDLLENTPAFISEIEKAIGQGNQILIDHGILSFGCTADDAGKQILELLLHHSSNKYHLE